MLVGRNIGGRFLRISPGSATGGLVITATAPTVFQTLWNYTTLSLNHFDGTDGETTFTDEISGPVWSTSGTASLSNTTAKFGTTSLFIGNGSSVLAESITNASTGDWTFEGWIFSPAATSGHAIQIQLRNAASLIAMDLVFSSFANTITPGLWDTGGTKFYDPGAISVSLTASTWQHWAVCCDSAGETYQFFFNGSRYANLSDATDVRGTQRITLTANNAAQRLDEMRIISSPAYSGATYTIPTSAFS